jgi:small subunit ribosomal protein S16
MAVAIRLARRGSKKRPYYWIVVADSRSPRDGAFIEKLGVYDPFITEGPKARLDVTRTDYWLGVGARSSDRVAYLLESLGMRKKSQKFNPKKGMPKQNAQERMSEEQHVRKSSVDLVAMEDADLDKSRQSIKMLAGVA